MFGWFKRPGAARAPEPEPEPFGHLRPGRRHRVVRAFVDHDGATHPVGGTWTFLRSTFLPYEDGLSLFVRTPEGVERRIRLQWRPEAEGPIVDALHDHVLPTRERSGRCTLLLTRDSVCLADDVHAPHAFALDVDPDADAAAVADAILACRYPAWVGANATWSLTLGPDRVLFGHRAGRRFVRPVVRGSLAARARDVERLHLSYLAQADPARFVTA